MNKKPRRPDVGRVGRPEVSPEKKKEVRLTFLVSPEEAARFQELHEAASAQWKRLHGKTLSRSTFLRRWNMPHITGDTQ